LLLLRCLVPEPGLADLISTARAIKNATPVSGSDCGVKSGDYHSLLKDQRQQKRRYYNGGGGALQQRQHTNFE
jgi:hypothetical protein